MKRPVITQNLSESSLFSQAESILPSPDDYTALRPKHLKVERIFLAKGSLKTTARARFVQGILRLYPEAQITECPEIPHNRIDLRESDPLTLHRKGKHTLVFGEHKSAVRFSQEQGNTCPNYWHFSPYGFCFYGCKYCYLAGTRVSWHSPTVKIYLNLDEIIARIKRTANRLTSPTAFYLGKLQDGLSLDPLTGYSTVLVPFFAEEPFARQVILTKSAEVDRLLELDHRGHTILSWSINPPEICSRFEENVPPVDERIQAMKRCAEAGYPVRAVMMPLIPVRNWKQVYADFAQSLLAEVKLHRLTLGGICIYRNARRLMERKLGRNNDISTHIADGPPSSDGRMRYEPSLRIEMYRHILSIASRLRPGLELALCLEERPLWEELGIQQSMGRCNCVI
jgi:spore photoproduct lyase